MWNESATRASECTAYPTTSSSRKKAESIPSRIMMRVDLERPMFTVSERACSCDGTVRVYAGPLWPVFAWKAQRGRRGGVSGRGRGVAVGCQMLRQFAVGARRTDERSPINDRRVSATSCPIASSLAPSPIRNHPCPIQRRTHWPWECTSCIVWHSFLPDSDILRCHNRPT